MENVVSQKKDKLNNIEILRILSMFLVVVSHSIYHGYMTNENIREYYQFNSALGVFNWTTMEALYVISCVAVNCFVMISGYFLIDKVKHRWNGILRIWVQTVFYCICFLIVAIYLGEEVGPKDIIFSILPIYGGRYWFVSCYIGLMLIAPFLSLVAMSIDKRQYQIMLLILFILNFQLLYGSVYGGFNTIMWFSFIYLMAGYIKIFDIPFFGKEHKGLVLLLCWAALVILAFIYNLAQRGGQISLVSTAYHGPVFFLSLAIFVYFVYTKIENRIAHIVVKVAPYTFGVYLIHDNTLVREWLWRSFIPDTFSYPMFIYSMVLAVAIFVACLIIDFLRSKLFVRFRIDTLIQNLSKRLPSL